MVLQAGDNLGSMFQSAVYWTFVGDLQQTAPLLCAELTLQILGGSQWHEAPTYLRILCFAPLIGPFSRLGGEVL